MKQSFAFLRKYKIEIIVSILLIAVYFLLRFYRIMSLPLFTDEAIYVRWSQIAKYDASWRFISMTDGKQPMFVWATMIAMKFFINPLASGRLVSVGTGFLTTIGLFFLGREIFRNRWIGILSALLYVVFPFGLVYDRMAMYDSMVGMFMVWSLYVEILLVRRIRSDIAFVLGLVIGGGMLTKTNAFFSMYLLPTTVILFDFKQKKRVKKIFLWIAFAVLSIALAQLYYSILRLSPFYNIISDKNSVFVYPFHDWIHHPFTFFWGNLKGLWNWFITYIKLPLFILIVGSFIWFRDRIKEKILLFSWFILPFIALAMFGRVLYPRFILFMTLPLLVLAAYSLLKVINFVRQPIFKIIIVLAFIALSIRADYYIVTDFVHAPIAGPDLAQYIDDWPAGGGVKPLIAFLTAQASKGQLYVATEGTFGSLPTYAVEIYLGSNGNVNHRGFWPIPDQIPQDLLDKAQKMPVYIVFNQTQDPPISTWPIKLIAKYQKGNWNRYMRVYQVIPQK
ncbi:MAG TPA: glycosyltransferase family 39 protein [Patescibacteria group bacterium]